MTVNSINIIIYEQLAEEKKSVCAVNVGRGTLLSVSVSVSVSVGYWITSSRSDTSRVGWAWWFFCC